MPTISVIVPVYKVERYIRRCVDSIISQTFNDWELILVDDGSPDNSGAICDDYAVQDERIRVIHKENAGVSAARNDAIIAAKGEYMTFVDSDDWLEPECLEVCIKEMQRHDIDLLQFGFKRIDRDGKHLSIKELGSETMNMPDYVKAGNILVCVWGGIYKTNIIKEHGIAFRQDLKLAEDQVFVYNYFIHCKNIKSITPLFYNYYLNSESATQNSKTVDVVDSITALDQTISLHPAFYEPIKKVISVLLVSILINHDLTARQFHILLSQHSEQKFDRISLKLYRKLAVVNIRLAYFVSMVAIKLKTWLNRLFI